MYPQPRRDVGDTGMSGAFSRCSHACRGHPALLERERAVVCVSLTLVTGSDSPRAGDWHRVPLQEWSGQCWDLHGASPRGQGCIASISLAVGGTSHPLMLTEPTWAGRRTRFCSRGPRSVHPRGPQGGILELAALCLGWQQEPLQLPESLAERSQSPCSPPAPMLDVTGSWDSAERDIFAFPSKGMLLCYAASLRPPSKG